MLLVIKDWGQAYIISMKRVELLSITKNEMVIRRPKKYSLALVIVPLLIIIATIVMFSSESMSTIAKGMAYVYNPVNSLYNDNSGVVFTSGVLAEKEMQDFVIPIKGGETSIDDNGDIHFKVVNSIMVMSPESGVVDSVGLSNDGIKYIKIRHSLNIYSFIENVDIVGVSAGQIVKRGEDIAIAKEGTVVTMRLLDGDTPLSGLKINQSKIVWKD